jgi:N-methylhydantoinase A
VAPPAFTFVQVGVIALQDADFPAITTVLRGLEERGRALVIEAGVAADRVVVEIVAAMRYVGQGFDVKAVIPAQALERGKREAIVTAFEAAYLAKYGRTEPGIPLEIVSWRVTVSGAMTSIDLVAARPSVQRGNALKGERAVYFGSFQRFLSVPVFDRYRFDHGFNFEGGCIIEERESTTIVPPGSRVIVDAALNLVIDLPAGKYP